MTPPDSFLARWAQRKAEVAKAESEPELEAAALPEPAADSAPEFDLASLPSLEDLTAETDIRPFMNALVPEFLRNAALRRVWELDPAIRDYVAPNLEYAWDWNTQGGAPGFGPLETGYKAVEAAARLFSQFSDDHTLVAQAGAHVPTAEPGHVRADIGSPSAAEITASQNVLPELPLDAGPIVQILPVNEAISDQAVLTGAAEQPDEKLAPDTVPFARIAGAKKPPGRHGGALPR